MKKIFLLATLLYLFIAPITYHQDNKEVLSFASRDKGKVFNIWEYGKKHFPRTNQFGYPPINWYMAKLQYPVAKFLGGEGYSEWLTSSNAYDPTNPNINRYMFASKFLLILFGLFSGYLIYHIAVHYTKNHKRAKIATVLWLFNPITIYSIPMMGQNDIFAITFFLAGWLLLNTQTLIAIAALGAAISAKHYPLIWVVILALANRAFDIKKKALIIGGSISVYLLVILPFVKSKAFREIVLSSTITDRFLYAQINIGFDEVIFIVPLLLIVVFALSFTSSFSRNGKNSILKICYFIIVSNLVLLGFAHFHPQWFTWLIPFWALWIAFQPTQPNLRNKTIISLLAFFCWLVIIFLFKDKSLTYGMLIPLNAKLSNLPVLSEFLFNKGIDISRFNNYAHTFLAGLAISSILIGWNKPRGNGNEKERFSLVKLPKIKFPLILKIFLSFLPLAALMIFVLICNFIPTPASTIPPSNISFTNVDSIETQFIANENGLSRIEIYLKNKNLESEDEMIFEIKNSQNNLISSQTFSGYNAGDPSTLRLEIPIQKNSNGQMYIFAIKKISESEIPLLVGMTEDKKDLAFIAYFEPSRTHRDNISQSLEKFKTIVGQLPILYLVLGALTFVSL